ncbi:hypothetical protein DFJ74DRAFT_702137 [Hyaloraphidium curvatum]|nr:hypothetical protein DFJ74DRAFT_702137 [Hyaloraphidium curvatum]
MVFGVEGKVALVTGGSEGIGLAVVEELLSRGCRVMIANRNEKLAAEVLARLAAEHGEGRAGFVRMDLADLASCKASFKAAVDAFGSCEIVFANAGYNNEESFLDGPDETSISMVNDNLLGTMMLAKAAVNHWLREGTPGVFVANSSAAGLHGVYHAFAPSWYSYHAAKAGIIQFCSTLQGDLESRAWAAGMDRSNIRTGVVCPGVVFTSIFSKMGDGNTPEEVAKNPLWALALPVLGGFTPMEKMVEGIIRLFEDEECRGTALVVSGERGEARKYPKEMELEDYVSRGSTPGNFKEAVATIKQALLAGANANADGVNGGTP